MMRITLDSPALIAVRNWLAGSVARQTQRSGRNGRRTASRSSFRGEQLEPRLMLDAGMRAVLPDLVEESDTGASFVDNFTSDRTPTLTGSVLGAASQVRLMIDGKSAAVIPVADGTWNYTVPAEAALAAGLTAAGLPGGIAVSSVLLFRLITFWIPTIPGYAAFNWLTKKGYL